MDDLGNYLSPFYAFHKNEVTTCRRWLMCASKMCNLGNELNLENSGCLWSCPTAKYSCVCVSAERPGVFTSRQLSFITVTVAVRNCCCSPPGTKLAEITAFQLRTKYSEEKQQWGFPTGMLLLPVLKWGAHLFCNNHAWTISGCAAFGREAPV